MQSNIELVRSLLKYTFGIVPVVAGIDKFTNLLTDWSSYIAPWMENFLPMTAGSFMMVVGIIEISAGVLVFSKTRIGAYVVMVWLLAIAFTLILSGRYLDVAVRDVVMAIAAYSLAKLTEGNLQY